MKVTGRAWTCEISHGDGKALTDFNFKPRASSTEYVILKY